MLKKLFKTFLAVAGISVLALMAVSCGSKETGGDEQFVTKEFTQPDLTDMSPSGWAYTSYSLNDFVGKEVTIDFSCEMKVDNPDGVKFGDGTGYKLMWQINNNGSYPEIVTHDFTSAETDWVIVT